MTNQPNPTPKIPLWFIIFFTLTAFALACIITMDEIVAHFIR